MTQIREYRIISKIGEGGMGEVFLAEDLNLSRKVAIKMLAPELMRNPEIVERFKQEAQVQSSLLHPNIVALYNFFIEDDKFYMVMEYVEGETLAQRLKRLGMMPANFCLPIFEQILQAVAFAHSKGIIHRDLKPSNIIISNNNVVKIMDFGIAKIFGVDGKTKMGTKMGTVNYMSPEQVRGEVVDNRTDIYSLAITLYEMLTGKNPYGDLHDKSEYLIMEKIIKEGLKDPREYNQYIPNWLVDIIYKATAKDRNYRIPNAMVFLNLIKSGPNAQNIPPKVNPQQNFQQPNVTPNADKSSVNIEPPKKPKEEANDVSKPKSSKKLVLIILLILVPLILGGVYFLFIKDSVSDNTELSSSDESQNTTESRQSSNHPYKINNAVFVKGGSFIMGNYYGVDNQKPEHEVYLNDFYISKYEVTVAEFEKFVDATGYRTTSERYGYAYMWSGNKCVQVNGLNWRYDVNANLRDAYEKNHPVIYVSWEDANAFARWVGGRLPTEAEWEYAAKGGINKDNYTFSGSDYINEVGYYFFNSNKTTHPVGTLNPNSLGLYDMTGNVGEWCYDYYDPEYYSISPRNNPKGPSTGDKHVTRGGAWGNSEKNCGVTVRSINYSELGDNAVGFRVVWDAR